MTHRQQIDLEVRMQARKFREQGLRLISIPGAVRWAIIDGNKTRAKPFRVSFERIQKIVLEMFT